MDHDVEKNAAALRRDEGRETGVLEPRRSTDDARWTARETHGQHASEIGQNGVNNDSETSREDSTGGVSPPQAEQKEEDFEVGWEGGDNDPLCPRSFHTGRKWLITIIVSSCGFCV